LEAGVVGGMLHLLNLEAEGLAVCVRSVAKLAEST